MSSLAVQKPRKVFLPDSEIAKRDLFISRKYRGFTGVAAVKNGVSEFRSGNSVTSYSLPEIEFKRNGIFIGEIYTPEQEDENYLQNALNTSNYAEINFAVYDVLAIDDRSLFDAPLRERIKWIDDIVIGKSHRVMEATGRTRNSLLEEITRNNWEGIVAADLNSLHNLNTGKNCVRRRGESWKLKPRLSLEFVVLKKDYNNVITAILPSGGKDSRKYKFGSFDGGLDAEGIESGDIVEVSFCSIDRDGNLVHPVVMTRRSPTNI